MPIVDRLEHFRQLYATIKPGWVPATAFYQNAVSAQLQPQSQVLDLGCGRGGIIERLQPTGTWTGVDPDWLSLREHRVTTLARSQVATAHLPFVDSSFDLVVASWVLEHVADPENLFAEVTRVLQPGGYFMFLTPNARHPLPRISQLLADMVHTQKKIVTRFYGRAAKDTFAVYYRANTTKQITQIAAQTGLQMQQVTLVGDPSYFAWNTLSFNIAAFLENLLPPLWKVHLVGEYKKPQ